MRTPIYKNHFHSDLIAQLLTESIKEQFTPMSHENKPLIFSANYVLETCVTNLVLRKRTFKKIKIKILQLVT